MDKILNVEEIQSGLINTRFGYINSSLSQYGDASLDRSGLLPKSIYLILNECVKKGYRVWRHNPPNSVGIPDYKIAVNEDPFIRDYYTEINLDIFPASML